MLRDCRCCTVVCVIGKPIGGKYKIRLSQIMGMLATECILDSPKPRGPFEVNYNDFINMAEARDRQKHFASMMVDQAAKLD